MSKLTATQTKALIMLAQGDRIIIPNRSPKIVYTDDVTQTTLWYVKQADVETLCNEGYIRRVDTIASYHYSITDAGRTALREAGEGKGSE